MKRIVSVWLPDWPVTAWMWDKSRKIGLPFDAWPDGALTGPFAIVESGPRGLVLSGLNSAARALGLRSGQSHADARAMAPLLQSESAEPAQARAALRRAALWAQRYAPLVVCDEGRPGMEGLWLDVTGAAHLFGGERALLADLTMRLERAGAKPRAAMAGTPGAAWALARFAPSTDVIAPPRQEADALMFLPLAALRLSPAAVQLMGRFGLRRIGDLYDLPRAALERRLRGEAGMQALRRLDQALGRLAEPLTGVIAPSLHFAQQLFAEPVLHWEGVAKWGAELAEDLCLRLEKHELGARRLLLTGFRTDGSAATSEVALSLPSRDPAHLIRLLRDRGWERLDVGPGLDALRLCATVIQPLTMAQIDSQGKTGTSETGKAMAILIDRLTARLGKAAVLHPVFRESWLPERSEQLAPCGMKEAPAPFLERPFQERPLLLLIRPEPIQTIAELPDGPPVRFVWRRVGRQVARATGPERLSPEWWRENHEETGRKRSSRTRDYYRIEDETGGRYWVFREGLYGAQDSECSPSWWMHGLFS